MDVLKAMKEALLAPLRERIEKDLKKDGFSRFPLDEADSLEQKVIVRAIAELSHGLQATQSVIFQDECFYIVDAVDGFDKLQAHLEAEAEKIQGKLLMIAKIKGMTEGPLHGMVN